MKITFLSNRYESIDLKVRIFLFLVDIIGSLLFFPSRILTRSSREYKPQKVKNILILRMDGLGDLVLSTAALREIRSGFPEANITLVVGSWAKNISKCISSYDHLIVHDCFLFSFFRGNRKFDFRKELIFIKELRKNKFDLGIDLRGDLLSIIPLYLSGAKFRFAKDTRGGGFLLTHIVKWNKRGIKHEKDRALQVVETLGLSLKHRDMELTITQDDVEYVEKYMAENGLSQSDRLVTIAPRALYQWKSWRPEKFAKVASAIMKTYNAKVVLVGSRNDRSILDEINALTNFKTVNSAGVLTLPQASALIYKSDIFIGNDSGLIHIAAAHKTPMVQIFGPGEPEKFAYTGKNNILLIKNDCPYHPCTQQSCKYQDNWCMDKITVKDVMGAFSKIIASQSRR
jgi:lipopolysaccharide heptosyltransferase II